MPLTDRDGARWLVYIEGVPLPARWQRTHAGMPGRRLRFDAERDSRVTAQVPAGAPYLADDRLQMLLDEATPISPEPSATSWRSGDSYTAEHPVIEWAARGRELVADWSRRWRQRRDRRGIL